MSTTEALCICGHEKAAHEHYRLGTECTFCGEEGCPKYRRRPKRFFGRRRD